MRTIWPSTGRDEGSATIEFIALGVLLLVPLVYLVIVLSRIQAASFAADSSARAAARAFVTAADDATGRSRAVIAVRLGLLDQGFTDPGDGDLSVECETPNACMTPGSQVRVQVEVRVAMPGLPHVFDRAVPTGVTVRAGQVAVVDQFRTTTQTAGDDPVRSQDDTREGTQDDTREGTQGDAQIDTRGDAQ